MVAIDLTDNPTEAERERRVSEALAEHGNVSVIGVWQEYDAETGALSIWTVEHVGGE